MGFPIQNGDFNHTLPEGKPFLSSPPAGRSPRPSPHVAHVAHVAHAAHTRQVDGKS